MTSTGMPMDAIVTMSTSLESILYGFSILMFMGTVWALTYNRRIQDINRPMAVVAVLLLILSTAHMVVDIIRLEDALGEISRHVPRWAISVLLRRFPRHSALIIILPCMLWCSVAVTGVSAVYNCSQANSSSIFAETLARWVTAFFASTIATNLLSSGLLAYRIWTIERAVSAARSSKSIVMPTIRVLVDAAVLYTVTLFTALICFVCSNNGETAVVDMAMPIMSIAFYMVLIRITINRKTPSYFSTTRGTNSEAGQGNSRQYNMKPLHVHVSQFTQHDADSVEGASCKKQSA
ncbi:hypothetical protein EDB19DRAFT_1913639 [Suillus lakei]|nr:hypothetical protein EDB19DRAFT_1913639 [Suillus lakei]